MKGFEGAGQSLGETEIWNMEGEQEKTPFLSIRGSSLAWGRGDDDCGREVQGGPSSCAGRDSGGSDT